MARKPRRLLAVALTGLFLGLLLAQFPLLHPGHSDTAIVVIANDSTNGASSLATEGGQKLIEDSFGRIIAVYVDSVGRLAVTYANSNPSLAGAWAPSTKSPAPSFAYSKPAAALASSTSLRVIAQGGTGPFEINDQFVTIQRDASQNIVGVSFGNSSQLDGSGKARHPAATIAHNGDILAAWSWESGNSSLVKTLRWKAGTGWTSFNGLSALPDDAIVGDSVDDGEIFPSIIQRKDNHHVYLIGNREESHPSTTLVFNKATFDGSNWSWGTQDLNYESNAARGVSDATSLTWDPVRNLVVAAYDITGTTIYGVFTLDALDQKVHIFTPSLVMTNNEWGSIEVDETTGDYYLFTMNTSIGRNYGMLGYTKRIGGVWNASLTILDSNTNNVAISVKRIGSSTSIDLLYARTVTDLVSQLRFARISTGPLPSTRPSDITISAQPNPSNDTESTAISGMLTDGLNGTGLPGRTVMIEHSLDQSNWLLLSQTTTVADGSYQGSFMFPTGTYYFRATFAGDVAYASSVSVAYQQTVQSEFPKSYAIVGDEDGKVYRLLVGTEGELELIGQPTTSPLRRVAWRPGGAYALIIGQAATLLRYDGNQFTPIATGLPSSSNLLSAAWKPDGSYALIAGSSGTVLKYDGASINTVSSPVSVSIRSISWHPNGTSALLVGDGGTMLVYENDLLTSFASGTSSDLHAVAWNPDGQYALVAGANGTILKHNGVSNTAINTTGIYQSSHVVLGIGWNSTGNVALLSGQTGLVLTYDGAALSRLPTLTSANLYSLDWSAWWANIVGGQGVVLKFSGSTLEQVSSGVSSSLRAIDWTEPAPDLDDRPPTQPQSLVATAAGVSRIDVSWGASNDNVAVWGYDIFRNGVKIATVAGAITSYSDVFVVLATTYTYYVVAFDAEGNRSIPSEPLSAMILFFNPTDDATIRQATPNNSYGFLDVLEVDNSPVDQFLIKFDVIGITAGTVTSAKIRLHNTNGSPKGGNFYTTASSSWTEISVTWNTAPANQTLAASLGQVSPGNWYEVDITSVVTGNGVVSLRASSTSTDGADFSSREGANSPELLVTVVDRSPRLTAIGDKAGGEEILLGFNATATDPGNDPLTFSLGPGAPAGVSLTSNGVFAWTPTESQGPGIYPVTVIVSDGVLADSENITITVYEVNRAPVLGLIGNKNVNEGETLSLTVTATDPDLPQNTVTLSMTGSLGAFFNITSGVFTWTPDEGQGPGTFTVTFTAADNGSPILSDNETITITVNEVNRPPSITVPGSQAATEGSTLTFAVNATDPDLPANNVTLSVSGLPAGASFNPSTGNFSWTPTQGQSGTYTLTFTATDNGAPSHSDSKNVTITVSPAPLEASFIFSPGTSGKPTWFNGTASGGTPPYTSTWDFGDGSNGSGQSVSHSYSVKGSYNVTLTVTDSGNFTKVVTQLVSVSPQPLVVSVVCSDGTAGKLINCEVSASGGTSPYTGTGNFSQTFAVKGTYTVSFNVTDSNGAVATGSDTISIAPQPLVVSVLCADGTAGKPITCDVSASGGTSPYTGIGAFSRSFAAKGTYTVSFNVTDANAVAATGNDVVVIAPQPLQITATCPTGTAGKPVSCDASASGGTASYAFSWDVGKDGIIDGSGPGFTTTFTVKGSYSIDAIVQDANNATARINIPVVISPQPLTGGFMFTQPVIAGSPATFNATASGGTSPYRFQWDVSKDGTIEAEGQTVQLTFPTKGTVSVDLTITDANNATARVNKPVGITGSPILADFTFSSPISAGKPANFTVTSVSGGTAPYMFGWDFGKDGTIDATGSSVTVSFPTKGTMSVDLVVTDANNAVARFNKTFAVEPQPLVVSAVCNDGTAGKPINCNVSATGGTSPYTGTGTFPQTFAVKGTYSISFNVTDANGVTAPGSDTVIIAPQSLVVNVVCADGTAGKPVDCDVSATGGTAPYQGTGGQTLVFPVKGTYTVSFNVTDANGVSASGSDTVTVAPQSIAVGVSFSAPSAGKPVNFTASVSGGTAPYTIGWNFGDNSTGSGAQVSHIYSVKGMYSVTALVTDANNATAGTMATVNVLPQPLLATASYTPSAPTAGKPVTFNASASGGTTPYSFSWNLGDGSGDLGTSVTHSYAVKGSYNVTLTVTDANGAAASTGVMVTVASQTLTITASCPGAVAGETVSCLASASGGSTPYSLSWVFSDGGTGSGAVVNHTFAVKGTYSVSVNVTDANLASASFSFEVDVSPRVLQAAFAVTPSSPTSGKPVNFTATASGGTAPYVFQWRFGDGSAASGQSVVHFYSVKGSYSVTLNATDSNGSTVNASQVVVVSAQPLGATIASSSATAGKPANLTSTVSGGTGPYTASWSFGDTSSGTGNPVSHIYAVKGTYNVTVTIIDANNSTTSSSLLLEVSAQPLTGIISVGNATAGKPTSMSITISGGTAPYTVSWDFGDSTTGTGDTVSHVYNVKGSYLVSANLTDTNSVSVTVSTPVTVTPQPLAITASCDTATAGKPITCNAAPSGGTSPYLVLWDIGKDGSIDGQGESFTTVFPVKGTYSTDSTVRDANNVTAGVNVVVVVEPQPLTATTTSSTATTGKPVDFTATISGGTGPYSAYWTFGDGTNSTGNPVSHIYSVKGSYNVTISLTDANGNTASATTMVNVSPQPLTVTAQCANGTAGKPVSCSASATGGTSPYAFSWMFSDNTTATGSDVSHVFAVKGSYTVTVNASDANADTATSVIAISVAPQPLLADFTMSASTASVGENLVLTATASGGTLPYLFSWNFGDGLTASGGSVTHAYSVKGSYTISLTATDVNGAVSTATRTVTILPVQLVISGVDVAPVQPAVGDSATFTATVTGGTAPYVVVWDLTGDNVSDAQGNPVGWAYTSAQNVTIGVYASDANGATSLIVTRVVTVVPFPISEFEFDWADYDNSGKVDIVDVASAAACFDLTPSSAAWSSCAYWDFDLDDRIGIVDIAIVASQFDRTVTSPFPGESQAAGVMDPQWHQICYLLAPADRAYCENRLG